MAHAKLNRFRWRTVALFVGSMVTVYYWDDRPCWWLVVTVNIYATFTCFAEFVKTAVNMLVGDRPESDREVEQAPA